MHNRQPRLAIVYDWIDTAYGGAEKVLVALHEVFPDAPIYTSVALTEQAQWAKPLTIVTSFLQRWPGLGRKPRQLLPLLPLAFESFDLSQFDVVISVTSAQAKGVLTKPNQLHVCYLLTPPRYLFSHRHEYVQAIRWPGIRQLVSLILTYVRWWDEAAALRPDVIVPISQRVADRCQVYYHRSTSPVIYPPVAKLESGEGQSLSPLIKKLPTGFALVISRLVAYKRIDLAIQACLERQQPLVIIGDGEERARLTALAGSSPLITFLGSQPQTVVNQAMSRCQVVMMPGIEDFGITAAEAIASGKPAVVHADSGVAELIEDGVNGILINELSVAAVVEALTRLHQTQFKSHLLQQTMKKYATTTFGQQMQSFIMTTWRTMQSERHYERT